jgi:hypothetical protein
VVESFALEHPAKVSDVSHVVYLVAPVLQSVEKLIANYLAVLPEHVIFSLLNLKEMEIAIKAVKIVL